MIFLPRSPDDILAAEEKEREERKIGLKTKEAGQNAYELTSATAKALRDYEPILDASMQVAEQSDTVFQAVEWVKKNNCIIALSNNIDKMIKALGDRGITLIAKQINRPFLITHDFIRDRSEFEAIADSLAVCVSEPDGFYLCYDRRQKKHYMAWSTSQPSQRQECVASQGEIRLEPA